MCRHQGLQINSLTDLIVKVIARRTITEAQLALSKVGGKITASDLKNMSLEHFICLCAGNQIQIKFK